MLSGKGDDLMFFTENEIYDVAYIIRSLYSDEDRAEKTLQALLDNNLDKQEICILITEISDFCASLHAESKTDSDPITSSIFSASADVGGRAKNAIIRYYNAIE